MLCLPEFDTGFILMVEEQSALEVLTLPGTVFLTNGHSITETLFFTKAILDFIAAF